MPDAPPPLPKSQPSFTRRHSTILKLAGVGALILLFLIPLAMIEGVLRHCTDMEIQRHYVDSHGQSEVAFAFCYLLNFELAPRLKAVARLRRDRCRGHGRR